MKIYSVPFLSFKLWLFSILIIGTSASSFAQIKSIKPFGKSRALVVGVSEYQQEKIPHLNYAHKDAEVFAHFLQHETAWKVAPQDIILLTNEEATYGKFLNELQALKEECQPKDRLIIYFSGHGDIEVVSDNKMGYLLFYDVSPTTYASGGACMVNTLNDFLQELVTEKNTEVILITDACRSGALAGSSIGGPEATTAALLELFNNTTKILSCEPHQLSLEGDWGGGRGLFSYHLVNGLKGMADQDGDNYVDLFELERYVQDSVRKDSEKKQLPRTKGLSSLRLSRIDRNVLLQLQEKTEATTPPQAEPVLASRGDTSFLPQLARFEEALAKKQLLYPEDGSAYQIYSSLGDHPSAQPIKKVMKISLSTALQDEAQQALNEYIVSPGKELAKRWANAEVYDFYPDYLGKAAELLGKENYFHNDIKSREHYFRGVNLRLKYDKDKDASNLLQLALQEQQKALQLQPIAPHVYNELGLIYKRLGQNMQAITSFQQALTLSPRWSLALTNLAFTYHEMEQYPQAEKIYKDAINLDTTFALSHYNLAVLYEEMDQADQAIVQLQKTVACDPQFSDAYYNLAYFFSQNPSKYVEAENALLKYIRLKPADPDGYSLLGYIYLQSKQWSKARQTYESVLMMDSTSSYNLSSLAYVYRQLTEYGSAKNLYQQLVRQHPDELDYQLLLARMLSLNNEQEAAIEVLGILLQKGYKKYEEIHEQEDFKSLHDLDEYKALLKKYFPEKQ